MKTNEKFFDAICFFGDSYSKFSLNIFDKIGNVDVLIFSKNVFKNLSADLQDEGSKKVFKELLFLSKKFDCVLICQTMLDDFGEKINSVLVFEKGKMLGICQEVSETKDKKSESVNLYDFDFGRVGILLGKNCDKSEFFELCCSFKCDAIWCFCDDENFKTKSLLANYFYISQKVFSFLIYKNNVKIFCENKTIKNKNLTKIRFKNFVTTKIKNKHFYLHKVIFENEKNF